MRVMTSPIDTPDERVCERCGRIEHWNDNEIAWSVAEQDGNPAVGSVYCIHEWDINGAFVPVSDVDGDADVDVDARA